MTTKLQRNQNRSAPFHGMKDTSESGPAPIFTVREDGKPTTNIAKLTDKDLDRIKLGARNFIQADRSDPFTAGRVAAHCKIGISGYYFDDKNNKLEGFYDAKQTLVTRKLPEGQKFEDGSNTFNVVEFVDPRRP